MSGMDTDLPPALDAVFRPVVEGGRPLAPMAPDEDDGFRPVVEGGRPLPPMALDDDDGGAPGWAAELPPAAPAWL